MASLEEAVHSFIIRLWCEEPDDSMRRPVWLGHITHVPSAKRRYIFDLDDVKLFISDYLRDPECGQAPGRPS